ncbi:MAG: Adenylate kinase [Candidatus Uhrbacteria bacterium GW2011_GWA2_53_10]|uniref:Adenylate kinase n=1 Tax=Candidatus Uhrbacteria bacterium GW2011_GWA2_53_10 TaxID=1618980 RepID=A0A0G1XR12_9BACT|nr:MAG: Adenylate kinase [Candidatus Uhrbacteria bacterium GW2011_GWA2_53_10]
MSSTVYKVFFFGPQGSGKGTQAELLAKRLNVPAFGMGQLCREAIASQSEMGKEIDAVVKRGELVSDHIAAELFRQRLQRPDTAHGYIMDGYPRNASQAQAFTFDTPTHVVVIEIPEEESVRRLSVRLTCDRCSKVYAMKEGFQVGNACECEGKLFQRSDDTPAAIEKRLEIYEHDTKPIIDRYAKAGIVYRIDGVGTVKTIERRIAKAIGLRSKK